MDATSFYGIEVPELEVCWSPNEGGASLKKITAVGLDLAKAVFQVHGVDEQGHAVLRKSLRRSQLATFFSQLPPCLIGMEACSGAHHWARKPQALGHEVRLVPPQYVKPYVKTNKTDAADAQAICEAMGRPGMRFVPVKTVEQQAILAVHRAREGGTTLYLRGWEGG